MRPHAASPRRLRPVIAVGMLLLLSLGAWAVVSRRETDPDRVWEQAETDFQAGRYTRATAALSTLARLRTPTPRDRMLRAQVAMHAGRNDEAIDDLRAIPDVDQLASQARLLAGQLELRRHRMRKAEGWFVEALKLDPKSIQARRELIFIYGLQLRRKELSREFLALSKVTSLTFDNVFHWCLTRNTVWEPKEMVTSMTRAVEADPDDRWSRIALAESLRQLGQIDDAARVIEILPADDPDARALRARLALDRGDDRAAEELLAEGPLDHPILARLRGRLALARRDGPAALRHFRAAYAAEPDNRDTLFGLATALSMVGKDDEAAPYFKDSKAHDEFGTLMQRAAGHGAATDAKLLRSLGASCEEIRRFPEARAWYNLAIDLNPLDTDAQQALYRLDAAR